MALVEITRKLQSVPKLAIEDVENDAVGEDPRSENEQNDWSFIKESLVQISTTLEDILDKDGPSFEQKESETVIMQDGLSLIADSLDALHETVKEQMALNTDAIMSLSGLQHEENKHREELAEKKEDEDQFRRQRQEAARDRGTSPKAFVKKMAEKAESGLSSVLGVIKNLFGTFINKLPMIVGGLLIGASAFMDPEELNNVFVKIKEKAKQMVDTITPIFDIFMDSVFPSLKRLVGETFELFKVLFSDYIIPGIKAVLPYVGKVFEAIGDVIEWTTDALKNPIETGRRLALKLENSMLNMLTFLMDGIDRIKITLGKFINTQIDRVARFIPGAAALKTDIGSEAMENIERRSAERRAREDNIADMIAVKAVRVAKSENANVNTRLVELTEKRNYLINNSELGSADPRVQAMTQEIDQIRNSSESYSNVVDIRTGQALTDMAVNSNYTLFAYGNESTVNRNVASLADSRLTMVDVSRSDKNQTNIAPVASGIDRTIENSPNITVSPPETLNRLLATEMMSAVTLQSEEIREQARAPSAPTVIDTSVQKTNIDNSSQTYIAPNIETSDPREKYYYNSRR